MSSSSDIFVGFRILVTSGIPLDIFCITLSITTRPQLLPQTQSEYNTLNDSVMSLQIELNSVAEELDEVKSKMESLSTTVTDTAPIVKIKDAFQKLRQEVRQLDVKIGVVGHTLMQAKLRQKNQSGFESKVEED